MQEREELMATAADQARNMLGDSIRAQRQMANLSLRQLSALTKVSNGHLSQVEHGVHKPSLRVLKAIADALNVSRETLFEQAGLMSPTENQDDQATEHAIRTDRRLTNTQRQSLLAVYGTYVRETSTGA